MTNKAKVRITLDSEQDGEKQSHTYVGEWYRKDRTVFVRYADAAGQGQTRTTVRWREGELSVMRYGDVESEQQFAAGARRPGLYVSRDARFRMETETKLLWMLCGDMSSPESQTAEDGISGNLRPEEQQSPKPTLPMMIEWHYRLLIEEQPAGDFVVRLRVVELDGSRSAASDV